MRRAHLSCYIPREARPRKTIAAAIGLLNVATVIAPLAASFFLARRLGASRGRAVAFVAVSSLLLTSALVLTVAVLRLAM